MARTAELSGNSSTEREGSRQGRSSILITMAAAVLVIVLPSLEAKATCQDLINNDTYRCRVKADTMTDSPIAFVLLHRAHNLKISICFLIYSAP